MKRREALKASLNAIGISLGSPLILELLNSCQPREDDGWTPAMLSQDQDEFLKSVCDAIIPPTHTPGAVDVGVNRFIDILLMDVFPKKESDQFLSSLDQLDRECQLELGQSYTRCDPEQRLNWLKGVDGQANEDSFFVSLKRLCVTAYFGSEEGMKQNYEYKPIPGEYDGSKTWNVGDKVIIGNHV